MLSILQRVFLLKPYGKPCSIWFTKNALVIDSNGVSTVLSTDRRLRCYIVENLRPRRGTPVLHEIQCINANDSICANGDMIMFGYWNLKNDIFVAQNCMSSNNASYDGTPIHQQLAALQKIFNDHVVPRPRLANRSNTHSTCALFVPFMFQNLEDAQDFVRNHASSKCGYDIYSIVQLSDTQPRYIEEKLHVTSAPVKPNPTLTPTLTSPTATNNTIVARPYGTPPPPPYRQNTSQRRVFRVSCTPTADLYDLHESVPPYSFIGHPFISDYSTSKYMNKLFHNIRENENLDLIEESDDEDDFENISHDRWIANSGFIEMEFSLHTRFNKWIPVLPSSDSQKKIKYSRGRASCSSPKRDRANQHETSQASAV